MDSPFPAVINNRDDITHYGLAKFIDDQLQIMDRDDNTKKVNFDASGVTTGTTRTLVLPDKDGTINVGAVSQTRIINGIGVVGGAAGWAVGAAASTGYLGTVAASQTAGTFVVPIPGLKVGDTITAFHLIGQIESAGGTVTLDADLRKHTAVAAEPSDASVGSITQISVTADTKVDNTNAQKASLTEVVAQDETFYVLLTATTAGSTDIILLGIGITVTEA